MSMLAQAGGSAGYLQQLSLWFSSFFGENAATALAVLKVIGIDIVLAGDNAVVIAMACRGLPPNQRKWGIILGAGAAVGLRIIFAFVVLLLFNDLPYVRGLGGVLLLWIAFKLIEGGNGEEGEGMQSGASLWEAVRIVALADLVMSFDNVIAIAAAAQSAPEAHRLAVIIFGLIVSIPLVVAGSTLITNLLTRYPILIWAGAALLGYLGGQLVGMEPVLKDFWASTAQWLGTSVPRVVLLLEVIGILLVVVGGWLRIRRRRSMETP